MVLEQIGKGRAGRGVGHLLTRREFVPMGDIVLTGGLGEFLGRSELADAFDFAGFLMAEIGDGVMVAGAPGGVIA